MNKESKEEACSILAQEYSNIAKASGFKHKDVYSYYMNRCMDREDEIVAEQTMREAYKIIKKDPQASWEQEWYKEKQKRIEVEKKYEVIVKEIKELTPDDKSKINYLTNYAIEGMGFL
ncbi:MAG: hypothetical protein ABGY11_10125 [Candidatus Thioglobus sp.]|jgi:formyltetrahydrofolate hydrolase